MENGSLHRFFRRVPCLLLVRKTLVVETNMKVKVLGLILILNRSSKYHIHGRNSKVRPGRHLAVQ
jgi:ribosomal protein S17